MDAPRIFLSVITILNVAYALIAWESAPTFIAWNGFDNGGPKALFGYGMSLLVLAGATAAPVFSGPKASKVVCQLSTCCYGAGAIIGATGGNYIMLGHSAVIGAICAFFGFCSAFGVEDHSAVERDVSMSAKIFAALYPVMIFFDGMQCFINPAGFSKLNGLDAIGPKMFQGWGLVHLLASFAMAGSRISGPEAIRSLCRVSACAVSPAIIVGAASGNMNVVVEGAILSSVLAYCGFSSPSQRQIVAHTKEGLLGFDK